MPAKKPSRRSSRSTGNAGSVARFGVAPGTADSRLPAPLVVHAGVEAPRTSAHVAVLGSRVDALRANAGAAIQTARQALETERQHAFEPARRQSVRPSGQQLARDADRRLGRVAAAVLLSAIALFGWASYRLWPRHLSTAAAHERHPSPSVHGRHLVVPFANDVACAQIASFDDQLEAFLRFEYLRGRNPSEADRILLTAARNNHRTSYKIFMLVENDQLAAASRLNQMQSRGLISRYELAAWSQQDLAAARQESQSFDNAYRVPANQKLESLATFQLQPALADFLVFKSQTDWRVVGQNPSAPQPLTHQEALHLAGDILEVARFYDLPLDYFLGVGAMENNYMNVNGDLAHSVWKAHAEPGDIVLERARKRVRVSDYSVGAWQVSRETLRTAHQLYVKDKRDYSKLSPHLRPPRELDLNSVTTDQLTTYAGLVLRNLLDRFGGDVDRAIGAYNGGVGKPNPNYAANVKNIALYARRMLEHAPLATGHSPASYSRESLVL